MTATTTRSGLSSIVAHRRTRHASAAPGRGPDRGAATGWQVQFVEIYGKLIILAAFWSVLRFLTREVRALESVDDVFAVFNLPASPSLFSTVLLFVVGGAVRRRMRAAWWLLLAFQIAAIVYAVFALTNTFVFDQPAVITPVAATATLTNIAVAVALTVLLLTSRRVFTGRVRSRAGWSAAAVIVGGLAVSTTISITATLGDPGSIRGLRHQLEWALRVVVGLAPDRTDIGWAHEHGPWWIAQVCGWVSALAVVAGVVILLRAGRHAAGLSAQEEFDLRGLLADHGGKDSLGYFATRREKSAIFTARRDAAVTYRVVANVSLVSGDPVGARGKWPEAIAAWLRETRANGWYPAVLSASEVGAQAYVASGLKAVAIGDEAIIETERFSLNDPGMAPIRRATRRITRLGYEIVIRRHADMSATEYAEFARCAHAWLRGEPERGFSMALGRLGDPLDGQCVAVLARDNTGQLRGLLSLVPWGTRGLSLDLMRRDPSSPNGLNEAMVATLVRRGRDELGVDRISLNFAMFRGVFNAAEQVGAGPLVRLANSGARFASRYWQIESLYRTNARYQPGWHTRYLCYDSPVTLARVAAAAGAAEGFLTWPGSNPRVQPREETAEYEGSLLPLARAERVRAADARQRVAGAAPGTQQQRARQAKLNLLRANGIDPYPPQVPHDTSITHVRAWFTDLPAGRRSGTDVAIVGRIRAVRDFGSLMFLVLQEDHAVVQAILSRDDVGAASLRIARRCLDLGDLVSVTGEVVASAHGELSVQAHTWQVAAKCLMPVPKLLPAGVARRHSRPRPQLELITEAQRSEVLTMRSTVVREVRAHLAGRDFVEVETPMLQPVHGGANARPFVTHINAYDTKLYLRIAPELHLKRLCVGGMQRIFELNRNFRNEGADHTHNPEFTSLEVYQAFADYRTMLELARAIILDAAGAVRDLPVARRMQMADRGEGVDLSEPWRIVPVHHAVSLATDEQITPDTTASALLRVCRDNAVAASAADSPGRLVVRLYEQLVEATTLAPTFYLDFPVECCPLTRQHRSDPRLAERWDLVAFGQEIGTAYTELTDPVDQRQRLTEQSLRRADGDPEAMQLDEDFLTALSYAMPPTGGLGIGVDRLVMMLANVSIRDTLAFPFAGGASEVEA